MEHIWSNRHTERGGRVNRGHAESWHTTGDLRHISLVCIFSGPLSLTFQICFTCTLSTSSFKLFVIFTHSTPMYVLHQTHWVITNTRTKTLVLQNVQQRQHNLVPNPLSSKLQFHLKAKSITLFQGDVWQFWFWNEFWQDPYFQIDNSHNIQLLKKIQIWKFGRISPVLHYWH